MDLGPGMLSDSELLAVLLRSGLKGKDVIALAREILSQFGGLRGLFAANKIELRKVKGTNERILLYQPTLPSCP